MCQQSRNTWNLLSLPLGLAGTYATYIGHLKMSWVCSPRLMFPTDCWTSPRKCPTSTLNSTHPKQTHYLTHIIPQITHTRAHTHTNTRTHTCAPVTPLVTWISAISFMLTTSKPRTPCITLLTFYDLSNLSTSNFNSKVCLKFLSPFLVPPPLFVSMFHFSPHHLNHSSLSSNGSRSAAFRLAGEGRKSESHGFKCSHNMPLTFKNLHSLVNLSCSSCNFLL